MTSGLPRCCFGAGAGGLRRPGRAARRCWQAPRPLSWVRLALEPLRRAGREGYSPSTPERRQLAVLGAGAAIVAGWFLGGAAVALPLAVAGPGLAAWAISSRRARYRADVERALPEVATAIADSLTAGRSLRASLPAAATSLDGPPAVELARLGAELDLGAPTAVAIESWRRRMRSARVDSFAAALLSQRLSRRRPGRAAAPLRRRAPRSATGSPRTPRRPPHRPASPGCSSSRCRPGAPSSPSCSQPGFLLEVLRAPASAVLLALAAGLQLAGFVAIRQLSKVAE